MLKKKLLTITVLIFLLIGSINFVLAACIPYTEGTSHIGEDTCVTGTINNIHYDEKSNTTFLNFCADYKTCPFNAVIFSSDKSKFPSINSCEGKDVEISGLIKEYQGRSEIILNNGSQLKGCDACKETNYTLWIIVGAIAVGAGIISYFLGKREK